MPCYVDFLQLAQNIKGLIDCSLGVSTCTAPYC